MNTTENSTQATPIGPIGPITPISPIPQNPCVANALALLDTSPPEVRQAVLEHVARHYPDSDRSTVCPTRARDFDLAKARCLLTRQTLEKEIHQKNLQKSPQPAATQPLPPVYTPVQNPSQTRPTPVANPSQTCPDPVLSPSPTRPTPAAPSAPNSQQSTPAQPQTDDDIEEDDIPFHEYLLGLNRDPSQNKKFQAHLAKKQAAETARIQQEIAENLNPLSPLDDLAPAQQQILFNLLRDFSAENVCQAITQPPPLGWGVQTTGRSLHRFKNRYAQRGHAKNKAHLARLAADILSDHHAADADLLRASEHLFRLRLLETVNDPEKTPRELNQLFQIQHRLHQAHLAEKRLALHNSKPRGSRGNEAPTSPPSP